MPTNVKHPKMNKYCYDHSDQLFLEILGNFLMTVPIQVYLFLFFIKKPIQVNVTLGLNQKI